MISHRPPGTSPGGIADAPIYARLVQERGDVPADIRGAAEHVWREVQQAMDSLHHTHPPGAR